MRINFNIKYKTYGRNEKEGMDCYGYAIYVEKQLGKELVDILDCSRDTLNIKKIPRTSLHRGSLIECSYNNHSHIGVMLDKDTFTHMTREGVRVNRIECVKVIGCYDIV